MTYIQLRIFLLHFKDASWFSVLCAEIMCSVEVVLSIYVIIRCPAVLLKILYMIVGLHNGYLLYFIFKHFAFLSQESMNILIGHRLQLGRNKCWRKRLRALRPLRYNVTPMHAATGQYVYTVLDRCFQNAINLLLTH